MHFNVPKSLRIPLLTAVASGALLLGACGGAATPDPQEVARLAAQAVAATLTAQPALPSITSAPQPSDTRTPAVAPSQTPPPTSTPTLAPTDTPEPSPTSAPTLTPTVTVRPPSAPAGWRYYELISGEAMLAYPATWEVTSETEDAVTWHDGKLGVITMQDATEATEVREGADAATQARELKRLLLAVHSNLDSLTFPDSGQLPAPGKPAYVLARAKESDLDIAGWASFVASQDHVLLFDAFYVDQNSLADSALQDLLQVVDSVRFSPYVMPTPAPTPTPDAAPKTAKAGNLRAGLGTNYAVVGSVKAGEKLTALGRSEDGKWLEIETAKGEAWISTQLLADFDASGLPVKMSSAPTVTPAPKPAAGAQPAAPGKGNLDTSSSLQIGQEVEANGWRFKVSEVHKRKAVYFYDTAYIAQGHFLVVIIDATNLQPGTAYFADNIDPYVTDVAARTWDSSWKGSSYAEWQYSISSLYSDVNPGGFIRMAVAYDLPDSLGDAMLSTGPALKWIYLGNFSQMPSEDS